jgi:hypothetical protein
MQSRNFLVCDWSRVPADADDHALICKYVVKAVVHMRCASDLTCRVYFGAPQQKSESIGDGKITVADKTREVCLTGQCRVIGRCPALVWTAVRCRRAFVDGPPAPDRQDGGAQAAIRKSPSWALSARL